MGAVERHGGELERKVAKAVDDRRKALSEALEAVEGAHAQLADQLALRGWLSEFPERARWQPGSFASSLPALQRPSGEPEQVATVLAALRELAESPKPEVSADQRSWPNQPDPTPLRAVPRAA